MVSMAHNESFGLTPIESFLSRNPALFVDEGGFRDTIVDGENERLIDRSDIGMALRAGAGLRPENPREVGSQGQGEVNRELDLGPDAHARRIGDLLYVIERPSVAVMSERNPASHGTIGSYYRSRKHGLGHRPEERHRGILRPDG